MTELLLAINYRGDEHFDIIALHSGSEINEIALAAMNYARRWNKKKVSGNHFRDLRVQPE